ncbi:MAG: hypothetical protein ACOVN9_07940, partial [Inhella sp.]
MVKHPRISNNRRSFHLHQLECFEMFSWISWGSAGSPESGSRNEGAVRRGVILGLLATLAVAT